MARPRSACSRRSRPDLVVLDWMLPGMDGLEVLRRAAPALAAPRPDAHGASRGSGPRDRPRSRRRRLPDQAIRHARAGRARARAAAPPRAAADHARRRPVDRRDSAHVRPAGTRPRRSRREARRRAAGPDAHRVRAAAPAPAQPRPSVQSRLPARRRVGRAGRRGRPIGGQRHPAPAAQARPDGRRHRDGVGRRLPTVRRRRQHRAEA